MANRIPRVPVREQEAKVRATNFEEAATDMMKRKLFLRLQDVLIARIRAAWEHVR